MYTFLVAQKGDKCIIFIKLNSVSESLRTSPKGDNMYKLRAKRNKLSLLFFETTCSYPIPSVTPGKGGSSKWAHGSSHSQTGGSCTGSNR